MFIAVDKQAQAPVYHQIRDGIIAMVRAGALHAGDKLPGTRELARELGVSRKTVLQAYLELAADSWVESRPGSCTYILERLGSAPVKPDLTDPLVRHGWAQPTGERQAAAATDSTAGQPKAVDQPHAGAGEQPQASDDGFWKPYELEGRYFGMPRYGDQWRGEDGWINFSRAIPDVRLFPLERIKRVSSQMLWDPKAYFFDYGHPQGYPPLLDYVETRLAKEGIQVAGERAFVVICSGFQVSLNLLLALLLKPGDVVAVEDPTFNSVLNLLTARGIPHRGVPMEHDGMDVEYLERLLNASSSRERPKLIITIPTLHNPTGVTMSTAKRERLIDLAQRFRVPVIEDNWAMLLDTGGRVEPSLAALDAGGHVIQVGSFSKAFLPGTRVAWVVLPKGIALSFTKAKRAMDRSDSYFLQTLVHEFIKKGYFDLHCRKVERIYRARRELTDELMRQHFPSEVSWKRPGGGFAYWVSLPAWLDSGSLLKHAIARGVEFAQGNYFYVGRRNSPNFRLAFSTLTQPELRQGVRRLGQAIHEAMAEGRGKGAG